VLAAKTINPDAQNPNGFDVLILAAGSEGGLLYGGRDLCGGELGSAVLSHPTVIAVGKGAAVQFWDFKHTLYSDWGAVSVSDPAPALYPGRPDFAASYAFVSNPEAFLEATVSCRACVLSGSTINANIYPPSTGASGAYVYDASGAQLDNTTWEMLEAEIPTGTPVRLANWNLTDANLSQAQGLEGANLSNSNFTGAIMDPTNLSQANLSGATLATHLEHAIGLGTAILDGADLSGATLNGVDLSGARWNHTIVNGTVFDGADLRGAQLVGLQFRIRPRFNNLTVGQSNSGPCTAFQNSDLHDVSLTLAQATPGCASSPLLPGSTVPVDFIAAVQKDSSLAANVDLSNANFLADASDRSSLAGLDLHGINLSRTSFVGWPVDLSGTTLDDANLEGANLSLAELSGASLHNVKAAGAVFRGAHLAASGSQPVASFAGSQTNLEGADFIEADVSGASFASADLSADASGKPTAFDRALANGTDFNGVTAKQISFVGAHIYGNGEAFDRATDLSGADFTNALLAGDVNQNGGFNLTGALLRGAKFDSAQCIGCNFTGANLKEASFVGAYLPGAVLSNASLGGANLDNAWLFCGDLQNSFCPALASAESVPRTRTAEPSPTHAAQPAAARGIVHEAKPDSPTTPAPPATAERNAALAQASPSPRPGPLATAGPASGGTWTWALDLGFGEFYGPVPFAATDLTGASLVDIAYCPDGNPPNSTNGCVGDALLPTGEMTVPPIPCSTPDGLPTGRFAVALGACSTRTTTLFDVTSVGSAKPLSVTAESPAAWPTSLTGRGFYVGLDDGTVRLSGDGDLTVVAGQAGQPCSSPTAACGDGGPASSAQLRTPGGLAVGLDGALYVADPDLHRVRRVDPGADHTISTVAGTGQACSEPDAVCGDGGPATAAALGGPNGVWVDPSGILWIADDRRGLREVGADGTITTVGVSPGAYTVQSVVGDDTGHLYVAANDPDYLLMVTPPPPPAPPVSVCQQLALAPGGLVQVSGAAEVDMVNRSCQRQPVPDSTTVQQIEETYHVTVTQISQADWQRIPAGSAIPSPSSDPIGFTQAMWAIFEPVCARLALAPGDLVQGTGDQEVDVVDRSCQRRHVPDGATLRQIEQTYDVGLTPLPASDAQAIPAGAAIPSARTDIAGYAQSTWDIFQLACSRLTIVPGTLIQTDGNLEIDILNPGCQRQHVPDLVTLQEIEQTFHVSVTQLAATDWQDIISGPAIPSVSTDQPGFAQAMEPMFGSPCTLLNLSSGTLLSTPGNPEIDIVEDREAASCQRRHVPNPATLQQIQQTYNPPSGQTDGLSWQRIPAGLPIPDEVQDDLAFEDTMQQIFGGCSPDCGTSSTSTTTAPPRRRGQVTVGGQATPVVGTGTSGYNGTVDGMCNLLPANQVQLNHPTGLSVRADGDVLFADTGNNVVRAYVPAYDTVVDLGGRIDTNPNDCPVQGTPPGGFNQDGQWADQTELNAPQGVTATPEGESLFVVADTGNGRIRLLGPSPLVTSATAPPAPTSDTLMPTPSPSPTATSTTTPEAAPSATQTATPTPSATPTAMATSTASPSPTKPPTPDRTATPSAKPATATPQRTPMPPDAPTATATRPAATAAAGR
jgi:uncharacterized protein YjbI with pentapeptide repeats